MCVHLWGIGFGATELWSFTILKYGCCFVLNPNLLNLHESGIYTAYALSDDIQINGDTPFEFGALELWSRLCLQNIGMLGKCSHPHLLNKKDSGDGVIQLYVLFNDINICATHSKIWSFEVNYNFELLWMGPFHPLGMLCSNIFRLCISHCAWGCWEAQHYWWKELQWSPKVPLRALRSLVWDTTPLPLGVQMQKL